MHYYEKKSLRQHEKDLAERFSGTFSDASRARLRVRCQRALELLQTRQKVSPQIWAMRAKTLGTVARYIMHSPYPDHVVEYFGVTANTAIRCMAACVKLCKDRCAEYRQTGINPQAAILINPSLEYAKAVYEEWKQWTPPRPAA